MTLSISSPCYAATIGLAGAQNAASPAAGVHQLHDLRGPWSGLPPRPFFTRRSRCFYCFYRKLSAGDMAFAAEILEFWQPGEQGTARAPAINPCKFATCDLAGAEIVCDEPTFAAPFRIAILLIIERISQFVKDQLTDLWGLSVLFGCPSLRRRVLSWRCAGIRRD
jgi:hypothetical protein